MSGIEIFGRTISGQLAPFGVPSRLGLRREVIKRGAIVAAQGVPLIDDRCVVARAVKVVDGPRGLVGEFKMLGGPKADEVLDQIRNGNVVAFEIHKRVTDHGRGADGTIEVRSAQLLSVGLTGLDPYLWRDELIEVRQAELLHRIGTPPPPVVNLSPLPVNLQPYAAR